MSKFEFKIGEQTFAIDNLGESMNHQFQKLHESYFSASAFDINEFRSEAFNFLRENSDRHRSSNAQNGFFNNFTIIWKELVYKKGHLKKAEAVWDFCLKVIYEWESKNKDKTIHKGTPYYFWGGTCILNGDLEKGFLLIHQALEEDKKTYQTDVPQAPSYWFVTLDHGKIQFFDGEVHKVAIFLDGKLNNYRSSRKGILTLDVLRSKFLQIAASQEVVFYFVFGLFRLKRLSEEIDKKLQANVFSSLLQTNTLLDFCLVVENTIKKQNKYSNTNLEQQTIGPLLEFLSSKSSLNINGSKIKELSDAFKSASDFSNTLQKMLNSQYCFKDGTTLQPIEEDFAITYGFRNFGAHKIEDQPVVYKNFDEITRRILNALFFSIEKLHV